MEKKYTVEDIIKLQKIILEMDVMSLNEKIPSEDKNEYEIGDMIPSQDPGPQELMETEDLRNTIMKAVESLPPRQRQIIVLRFGLLDGSPKTLDEVGRMYGVTRERIRQIESKAIKRLRWLLVCKYKIKEY